MRQRWGTPCRLLKDTEFTGICRTFMERKTQRAVQLLLQYLLKAPPFKTHSDDSGRDMIYFRRSTFFVAVRLQFPFTHFLYLEAVAEEGHRGNATCTKCPGSKVGNYLTWRIKSAERHGTKWTVFQKKLPAVKYCVCSRSQSCLYIGQIQKLWIMVFDCCF